MDDAVLEEQPTRRGHVLTPRRIAVIALAVLAVTLGRRLRFARNVFRHRREAIRDCANALASTDRGQLVMACGTGKTLVGPFLADRLAAQRVLVLVPSLSLLGQTLREWATSVEFDLVRPAPGAEQDVSDCHPHSEQIDSPFGR